MEGLKFGWRKPLRSKEYHYVSDFSGIVGQASSLCARYHVEVFHAVNLEFLEDFEILDQSQMCSICVLKLQNKKQNDSKKEILTEINKMSIHDDGYVLRKVTCCEESCNETGISFVFIHNEQAHYCIRHNLRVIQTIQKEKEVAV